MTVSSSPEHLLCKSFFLSKGPVFYSGRCYNDTILSRVIDDSHILLAIEDLKVVPEIGFVS